MNASKVIAAVCVILAVCMSADAYYSPAQGRWLSRDPLGEGGCVNLVAFVRNDPVRTVDALGDAPVLVDPVALGGMAACALRQHFKHKRDALPACFTGAPDAWRHCNTGCEIARNCGIDATAIAGVVAEIVDMLGPGNSELRDIINTLYGIPNSIVSGQSCAQGCARLHGH